MGLVRVKWCMVAAAAGQPRKSFWAPKKVRVQKARPKGEGQSEKAAEPCPLLTGTLPIEKLCGVSVSTGLP